MTRPVSSKFTPSAKSQDIPERWYLIDLEGKILGRAASHIAVILRGKHRPDFTPHIDHQDHVVAINVKKVKLTGKKVTNKIYYRYTGYPGGIKSQTAKEIMEKYPERILMKAVKGMLPKGPLGRKLLKKLRVYEGAEHPHVAQKPETLNI